MSKAQKKAAPGNAEHLEGKENEWKFKHPYTVHENAERGPHYKGSCHCGRVKYQLKQKEPKDAKFCHCTTCQVLHGAPFGWTAIFEKDDINFTHGHHDLVWYDSQEKTTRHKLPCKVTCAYCRSPIMDEGRNMILLYPTLIQFEGEKDRKNFAPKYHQFYEQRVVDIDDGLPKWKGIKGESDQMGEDQQQRKRKKT